MTKIRKANGEYIEVEMQPYQPQADDPDTPEPTPTPEDQIAELKAQLTALETILLGGETNGND